MKASHGRKRSSWVADFETTTRADDCRVWAWAICNIENVVELEIDNSIESFVEYVSDQDSIVYFHNLAFDGSFIIDHLFKIGFNHNPDRPRSGEFSTLISSSAKFYSITVKWLSGKTTEFRDSLKKLPMSVKNVAKAFKLKDSKGELDYELFRPKGWIITPEEREYIRKDVVIIAEALWVELQAGMTKLTVGSDSLAEYKRLTGGKMFDRLFPVLPESMDSEIRRAYRGGFTYVADRFKGKLVGKGSVYDVNSLYPAVMYDRILPYDEPVYCDSLPVITKELPLFIVSITFTARLRPNHIPCIQVKGSSQFTPTEYQEIIAEPTTLVVTNVDLDLWQEHYDMDILSYNGGWQFKGVKGVFKKYIDKWMKVKETSSGGMKLIAKLHLNSLYGKFATNPNITPKIPTMVDGVVKLVLGDEATRNPVYTAMGVFITAYARDVTIRSAQNNYDTFAYADTDSLHLMTQDDPIGINVHPTHLGTWKHEYYFSNAFFVRSKCYTEKLDARSIPECECDDVCHGHEYVTHIAGMPETIAKSLTFEDYVPGKTFPGKLSPKRVRGGIVLTDVKFTLNL